MCAGNAYFKHRSLHKYTRVARGQDGVDVNSMIDLVLVKKDMLRYVQDLKAVRGMGGDLSDHTKRIRDEKFREHQYREGYARSPESKRIQWDEGRNVDQMWEQVK